MFKPSMKPQLAAFSVEEQQFTLSSCCMTELLTLSHKGPNNLQWNPFLFLHLRCDSFGQYPQLVDFTKGRNDSQGRACWGHCFAVFAESLNYKYFNRLPNTAMSFTMAKIFSVSLSGLRCIPCSTTSPFADVLKKEIFSRTLTNNTSTLDFTSINPNSCCYCCCCKH